MAETGPSRRIAMAVAAVVLAVAVGAWFLFLRDRSPSLSPDEARDLATTFLTEIRSGKLDEAWGRTSAEFKSTGYGRDRFRAYVKSKPLLKGPLEFQECEYLSEGGLRLARCTFRPPAGKEVIRVVLNLDEGQWKVGRLAVE